MLKITTVNQGCTLKLEGALREPWILELRAAIANAVPLNGRLSLDLADVTFVDSAALALLRELEAEGIQLVAFSGFVATALGLETT